MAGKIKHSDLEQQAYFSAPLTSEEAPIEEVIGAIAKLLKQINEECVNDGKILVHSEPVLTKIPLGGDTETKFRILIPAMRLKQALFVPVLGSDESQDWKKA